jgi:hypothetical protein
MSRPTQDRVKELFSYDPLTGEFRRRVDSLKGRWKAGELAGWSGTRGYRYLLIDGCVSRASSVGWLYIHGEWPGVELDHRNKDTGDDRLENLRQATKSQNQANKGKYKRNTSGFAGVTWNRSHSKWQAQIGFQGKVKYLGSFEEAKSAALAYDVAARQLFGEFARVNF